MSELKKPEKKTCECGVGNKCVCDFGELLGHNQCKEKYDKWIVARLESILDEDHDMTFGYDIENLISEIKGEVKTVTEEMRKDFNQ